MNMKGVTGNDGDVKTGVGTKAHEVKRGLRKTMRGKSGGATAERGAVRGESARCGWLLRCRDKKGPRCRIDAGETGGSEPRRRLSGGHC